ncbi:MAG: 30S ribosomal protein S5 [Nanoarchaeota archaeon]
MADNKDVKAAEVLKEGDLPAGVVAKKQADIDGWVPVTELGRKVKSGEIKDIGDILDKGEKILEPEIVDMLVPDLVHDLLAVGQSKGKFGGGKRSIWRQTQKKTAEGNKSKFAAMVVVGNKNGYVGLGFGKARETVPAREKAIKNAKINLIKVRRGCGSWECGCAEPHTIPLKVQARCGSIIFQLMPAPKGANLSVEKECSKILSFAGIKDIYSKTFGQTRTKMNMVKACFIALKNLSQIRIPSYYYKKGGVTEGAK